MEKRTHEVSQCECDMEKGGEHVDHSKASEYPWCTCVILACLQVTKNMKRIVTPVYMHLSCHLFQLQTQHRTQETNKKNLLAVLSSLIHNLVKLVNKHLFSRYAFQFRYEIMRLDRLMLRLCQLNLRMVLV
jgi:hypothetical protein